MRTLKNGREVKYYAICPECSSHLEYTYDDIQKSGGLESGSKYIVCPVCEERIKIKSAVTATPFSNLAQTLSYPSCGCT